MRPRAILGIDPGSKGCAFLIDENRDMEILRFHNQGPSECSQTIMWDWSWKWDIKGFIENVHSRPNDTKPTAFAFGKNEGRVEGMLYSARISFELVDPSVWQRHFSLYGISAELQREGWEEDAAGREAKRQYQTKCKEVLTDWKGPITLDTTDAQLIALWGWDKTFGVKSNDKK